jgi:hypothetical protein
MFQVICTIGFENKKSVLVDLQIIYQQQQFKKGQEICNSGLKESFEIILSIKA